MNTASSVTSALPRALTIAGSDSGGGAGIQADLKTFAALGVYGLSALTAITAQNTLGVRAAHSLAPELVEAQIEAVLDDIGASAVKTGMLSNPEIIDAVARCLARWKLPLVIDPVMVAKGGDRLLQPEAVTTLREVLLPLATVVTPNIPEAEVLTGIKIETIEDMHRAAETIAQLGTCQVIVKGGHLAGQAIDVFFDGEQWTDLPAERLLTRHTHGTGCTFSAALTALLARGLPMMQAVTEAKVYITGAIKHAPGIGHGHGPVAHFWQWPPHASSSNREDSEKR